MRTVNYNISYENLISRIPGMFAYVDFNEFGEYTLHNASDSPQGCYGHIVENIRIPNDVNLTVDNIVYVKSNNVYSYRTLIDYYYRFKNTNGSNKFIRFIERGIGKLRLTDVENEYNAKQTDEDKKIHIANNAEYDLVPDIVYMITATTLKSEMMILKELCDAYEKLHNNGQGDMHMCCECDKYARMGGADYIKLLEYIISISEGIVNEYRGYAVEKGLTLNLNVFLTNTYNDLGIVSSLIDEYDDELKGDGYKFLENGNEKILKLSNGTYEKKDYMNDVINVKANTFVTDWKSKIKTGINNSSISGQTDSKLKSLRRLVTYMDYYYEYPTPDDGTDWLFYYRKGIVLNPIYSSDENDNILSLSGNNFDNMQIDDTCVKGRKDIISYNLAVWGDYIENITRDTNNNQIKITYVINEHLTAKCKGIETDEDGNTLYYWGDYQIDKNGTYSGCGIKFVETYTYESNSEISRLQDEESVFDNEPTDDDYEQYIIIKKKGDEGDTYIKCSFDNYINGKYDNFLKFEKFPFITVNNQKTYERNVEGVNIPITINLTNFEKKRKVEETTLKTILMGSYTGSDETNKVTIQEAERNYLLGTNFPDIIREDYYNGISYYPDIVTNVRVERGNTTVLDRHIKLGDVKTLDDMVSYNNGSYFTMTES